MDTSKRNEYVSGIVSGVSIFTHDGKNYFIKEGNAIQKQIAQKIYSERFDYAVKSGIFTFDEAMKIYISKGLWTEEEENELDCLPDKIEELKLQLYNAYTSFKSREPVRKALKKTKERLANLSSKKENLRRETAEGVAEVCRRGYLTCCNVTDVNNVEIFKAEEYYEQEIGIVQKIIRSYLNGKPNETEIRELSRTEPWRGLWSVGKAEDGVFGKPSSLLTNEQKHIISWSRVYDSISESPEAPPTEVIEDDDLLDGWLILQSRKRDSEKKKKHTEDIGGRTNGDEVYVFADDAKEAARIYGSNTSDAKAVVRTRQKQIDSTKLGKGLPAQKTMDAQMEMQKQSNEKFKEHVKK